MMRWGICAAVLGMAGLTGTGSVAQQSAYPVFQSPVPVVSVNRESLIQRTAYGRAVIGRLTARQQALVAENDALTQELEREERELTELRKTLSAEEFRPLAETFDEKVKRVRRAQEEKAVGLAQALETARFRFFRQAEAVIARMMRESDILFVLDESVVWLSQGGDITQAVIERMDAAFAAGELADE